MGKRTTPSFIGLHPASKKASAAARGASAKVNTRCELVLRRELWRRGLRYRLHHSWLPGRPDIVFIKQRIVVFCDGDFWHGRDLSDRLTKLAGGHNATYWLAKVQRNVERDRRQNSELEELGWTVLRFWETDALRRASYVADQIIAVLKRGKTTHHKTAGSFSPRSSEEAKSEPRPISRTLNALGAFDPTRGVT
jgi:DNA mismatch endonuclease, patch repair protein